jgi:NitT/TauT family transport system ATP-binding protein
MIDQGGNVAVNLTGLTKRFSKYTAVEGITFDVREGSFLSIVGPSGCGKSTVLNMTAGLMTPTEGRVEIYGQPLVGLNRRAAYMFQQDALLPWRTVLDNVVLGLSFRRENRRTAEEQGRMWLKRVGLENFADRFPHQLSGGMRKRVAMAQSWIVDPDILLMDEPFGALDVQTRQLMENELLDLWSASRKTVMFITHDLEEAIGLSDEIVVLSAGPNAHIVGRYTVDLPRPRDLIDIRTEPHFGELYRQIWADLREEVLKSYEQQSQASFA